MPVLRPLRAQDMVASLALGLIAPVAAEPADEPSAQTIIVTGQREDGLRLDRLATPIIDTPQAISVITSADLEARGIASLNDALRNVAGLSLGAGETSFQGNNAILRGFTTRNDLFVDNARDYGYYYRDTFDDERVEVIKGPSSTMFGRGSTGGVIHRAGKMPGPEDRFAAEARLGLDDTRRLTVDANIARPLGEDTAVRLNAMVHHSAVAARDAGTQKRWGVAPKFSAGLGQHTRLTLAWLHQEENNRPDYGIPWVSGTPAAPGYPAPVDRSNYYGFTNDRLDTVVNIFTARIEHDLGDRSLLRGQLRYSNNRRDFRYSEAIIPAGSSRATPLDQVTVSRNLFEGRSRDRFLQAQLEAETQLSLGASQHHVILGVEAGREATDPVYVTNTNVPTTSLIDPDYRFFDSVPGGYIRLRGRARSNFIGLFALDTVSFGPRWRAILGLRWDQFSTRYDSQRFSPAGMPDRETRVTRDDRRFSGRAALVYKPAEDGSLYVSWANSFNPSGEGIESLISVGRTVAEANIDLAPENSTSYELGTKWNLFEDRALFSATLFRIEKDNVRVPDPATPGFNTLGGKQRVDGFEVEFSGQPLPGWSVRTSYALLDSQTLKSTATGPLVGAPLLIAPRHSGSFSTSYDFTPEFNAGFNLVASASRVGQNTAASYLVAGGYVVADVSATWRPSRQVTVRLLVNNITNRLYYDQLHPVHVIPGAGRTALVSLGTVL
ncbi:TonB-dependent receptor [Polymorphobacter sp.]|uniref:TonB-dependent receptor n=1 Tax=Polymorphobacter sp. TaxID=1909290 RepID=UPI003F7271EC